MHLAEGILYFDDESRDQIILIVNALMTKGIIQGMPMLITEGGKNPCIFLRQEDQDAFLNSQNLDPARLNSLQQNDQGYILNPAEVNKPGSSSSGGSETVDPGNILMYGRGGAEVRVVKRISDKSYQGNVPGDFSFKVVEKTCPDEWAAELEHRVMRELQKKGRRVAEVYRREGKVLDIEMVSPTLYDFANTSGRSQADLENLLIDAIQQKLLIYKDLPEIIDADSLEQIKKKKVRRLNRSFPELSAEEVAHSQDGLKLMKALGLDRDDNVLTLKSGVTPKQFLELYEQTYGWMLREERRVHARLLSDEYTKNRGVKDGKTIAFDFSPCFDIPQIDDLFLLQAGGNDLDKKGEMRLVELSAAGQGREFHDYFATYIAASPTRSYQQMRYILKDLQILYDQLEELHTGVVKVSPLKDPAQYFKEYAQLYASRLFNSLDEFMSYARTAKENSYNHGLQCYCGKLGDGTLKRAALLHNMTISILGEYLDEFLERQRNSIIFKGSNAHALPAIEQFGQNIKEGLYSHLFQLQCDQGSQHVECHVSDRQEMVNDDNIF